MYKSCNACLPERTPAEQLTDWLDVSLSSMGTALSRHVRVERAWGIRGSYTSRLGQTRCCASLPVQHPLSSSEGYLWCIKKKGALSSVRYKVSSQYWPH